MKRCWRATGFRRTNPVEWRGRVGGQCILGGRWQGGEGLISDDGVFDGVELGRDGFNVFPMPEELAVQQGGAGLGKVGGSPLAVADFAHEGAPGRTVRIRRFVRPDRDSPASL